MGQGTSATLMMKKALEAMAASGGEMVLSDILKAVESQVDCNDWDQGIYESSGLPRWNVRMRWHSTGFVKAGLIKKSSGTWFLTDEGRAALKFPVEKLRDFVAQRYEAWLKEHRQAGKKALGDLIGDGPCLRVASLRPASSLSFDRSPAL